MSRFAALRVLGMVTVLGGVPLLTPGCAQPIAANVACGSVSTPHSIDYSQVASGLVARGTTCAVADRLALVAIGHFDEDIGKPFSYPGGWQCTSRGVTPPPGETGNHDRFDWTCTQLQNTVTFRSTNTGIPPTTHFAAKRVSTDSLLSIATADVTGDGRPDLLATTNTSPAALRVYRQTADGTLAAPVSYALGPKGTQGGIAVGDLNGDHLNDVAVIGSSPSGQQVVRLFLQKGGALVPAAWPNQQCAVNVKAVDYNGDGVTDLVVAGCTGIDFYTRSGATWIKRTTFTPRQYDDFNFFELGDVNGDGRPDLVGKGPYEIWIADQTAAHTFSPEHYIPACNGIGTSGEQPFVDVSIGDVTGDGKPDITCGGGANSLSAVSVYPSTPSGTSISSKPATYAAAFQPWRTIIADINLDGRTDVLTPDGDPVGVGIYRQQNNGTLLPEQLVDSLGVSPYSIPGSGAESLAVADLDHNGMPDIAIGGGGGLAVIYQH